SIIQRDNSRVKIARTQFYNRQSRLLGFKIERKMESSQIGRDSTECRNNRNLECNKWKDG
ncbi:unnamed protein product, partial [Allacma fusca]